MMIDGAIEQPPRRTAATRRRAFGVLLLLAVVLIGISMSDRIAALIPRAAWHPPVRQLGPYTVTLRSDTEHPSIQHPLHLSLTLNRTDKQIDPAVAVQYRWDMPDMGMTGGSGLMTLENGRFYATVQATMTGTWDIHFVVHTPDGGDQNLTYEVPVGG